MTFSADELHSAVERLLSTWRRKGLPGRDALVETAARLDASRGTAALWPRPPTMLTATIDDGIGQGIDLIGRFAAAAGVQVVFGGLLQPPKRIVETARRIRADLVGLTVLQLDSEEMLTAVARDLPLQILLLAGGPAFRLDPELAERVGVDAVAANVSDFLRFLLKYDPAAAQRS
jgi:methylmalonyl-CoA mutase cobalamin-binding subunit